jgi:hypothetical protein
MIGRLMGGAALATWLVVSGCGGSGGDAASSSSCGFVAPVPKAPAMAPDGVSVQRQAEARGLIALDAFVGPYLRGETTVYRGTLAAHDNQSVLGSKKEGYESQSLPSGPAVASLLVAGGTATLAVHSFAEHKYLVLDQATKNTSDTTNVGIILPDASTGGNSGTCVDCVPDFGGRPASIAFANITGTQTVNLDTGVDGGDDDVTLHVYATADLELVQPCSVEFSDLAELNASTGLDFVLQGDEMVAEMTGCAFSPAPDYAYDAYTIELYVSTTNLADYGVRSFVLGSDKTCEEGVP